MITKLNLATNPFRNRVLPYLIAALLLVVSAVGGVYCLARLNENKKQNDLLVSAIQERQTEIQRLKGEGEKVQQLLTPEQKALLSASHKLVANKTFGWSRLFSDLESVLPGSVSASRIAVVNIYQDGDRVKAELELGVISRDYPAVMSMIENMNNSGAVSGRASRPGSAKERANNVFGIHFSRDLYARKRVRRRSDHRYCSNSSGRRTIMAEQEPKPVEVIVVPEGSEPVVIDEYVAVTIPPNRPRKVYAGMWGPVEISAVAVSTLAILAALVAYIFFVIPSNRELTKNKSEADRLDAEMISAKSKYGEITSTETQVAKLLASVDDFQTRFLPVSQNGQAALYQRLNGLMGAYGLVNTSGPDYAPLETADLNPGQQTDEERGRSKFRSL